MASIVNSLNSFMDIFSNIAGFMNEVNDMVMSLTRGVASGSFERTNKKGSS